MRARMPSVARNAASGMIGKTDHSAIWLGERGPVVVRGDLRSSVGGFELVPIHVTERGSSQDEMSSTRLPDPARRCERDG